MKRAKDKGFVERVVEGLESALALSRAFERLLVDVFVAYVPLFAPVIPATIAFFSLYFVLEMPLVVSVIGALVVEFLGLGTVTTTMQFVDYNASRNDDDPPAPTKTAISTTVFYLAVVLTVNVLLDDAELIHKTAKLLLSTLSVAGAVTISLRGQHARRLESKATRDAKRNAEKKTADADALAYKRQVAKERRDQKFELKKLELQVAEKKAEPVKVAEKVSETSDPPTETFGQFKGWRQLPMEHKAAIAELVMGTSKRLAMERIVEMYLVSERVAYGWIEYAERDFRTDEDAKEDLVAELKGELEKEGV